jgi:hypothetical protein
MLWHGQQPHWTADGFETAAHPVSDGCSHHDRNVRAMTTHAQTDGALLTPCFEGIPRVSANPVAGAAGSVNRPQTTANKHAVQ